MRYKPSDNLKKYLGSWLNKSKAYQTSKGSEFTLTLEDFMYLFGEARLKKLEVYLATSFGNKMHKDNKYAWVLTWKEGKRQPVMSVDTARVTTREISKKAGKLKKGDKHTDSAKKKIGDAKRGIKQSDDHKQKRSEAQKGVKRGPRDPEVTKRILATKAAKKLEAQNGK